MKLNVCLLLGCLAICQPSLAQFVIPDGTTTIPDDAFYRRTDLTNVVIPDSVTNIGIGAFASCTNLTRIAVGKGATTIAYGAFACMGYTDPERNPGGFPLTNAVSVCFTGNAPTNVDAHAFDTWTIVGSSGAYVSCNVTVYYLSGTSGWGTTLAGRPTICLNPRLTKPQRVQMPGLDALIFSVEGVNTNMVAVFEASTNMIAWTTLQTYTHITVFSAGDGYWRNYAARFYRVRPILAP